jgi:hypothetical protein
MSDWEGKGVLCSEKLSLNSENIEENHNFVHESKHMQGR